MRQPHSWALGGMLVLLCLSAVPVSARTWIASPTGDTGDGTAESILAQVADGDSLRLLSGEHQWPRGPVRTSLTIIGDDGAVIRGGYAEFRTTAFVYFENLTFGLDGQLFISRVDDVRIHGCVYQHATGFLLITYAQTAQLTETIVRDNDAFDPQEVAGVGIDLCPSVLVEDCVFERNRGTAGSPYDDTSEGGGALRLGLDTSGIVRRCVFRDNEALAGSAMYSRSQVLLFEHNTIIGNTCEAGAVVVHANAPGCVVRQNIFVGNAAFALWVGEQGIERPRVYCNAFWENNAILIGDFGEREGRQWRAWSVLGYESNDDFHSALVDPMFCSDSVSVMLDSPLATQEFPCEPIGGAKGFGCGAPPVIEQSWGKLKSVFGRRKSNQ